MNPLTDAELVEASRRGDATAFGEIVERYQRAVCAVSYSGTGDRASSEDVAQDTFVTAWRQLSALREVERLPAWLCGIARNLARAARRRRGREVAIDDDHDVPASDSPFDAVSDREAEQVVAAALARVPETYREPLVLFYCEQQSVKSVAERLGISEEATHQRLSRGRAHLADGVTGLVERTLERRRPKRDLVATVVAAIVLMGSAKVKASTTGTKGSIMLKLGAAVALVTGIAGTGYLVTRSNAEPTRSTDAVRVATQPTRVGAVPALPANVGALHARAGAPAGVTLDCSSVARHMTDLAVQSQPDLLAGIANGTVDADRIAASMKPALDHFEHECTSRHWSADYMACITAATDSFSAGMGCKRLAPPDSEQPASAGSGFRVFQDSATPQSPYVGSDLSCASVGEHVGLLSQPDPSTLVLLSPEDRERILAGMQRARATIPDQVTAACDQGQWSEPLRRCMLGATTTSALAACM